MARNLFIITETESVLNTDIQLVWSLVLITDIVRVQTPEAYTSAWNTLKVPLQASLHQFIFCFHYFNYQFYWASWTGYRRGCVLIVNRSRAQSSHGILVPGGFGDRGVQGKILAATYARTNGIPYLGICLGMQLAVVEYARNVGSTCICPRLISVVFVRMLEFG